MQKRLLAILLLAVVVACQNNRPIIGIYTQPSEYDQFPASNYSYIAASYIKFVEGAGAQAVVIPYDATFEYIDTIFNKVNGILFPGGDVAFEDSNPNSQEHIFLKNAVYIVQKAKNATDNGDFFPLWGTCLGFQLLNFIESGFNSTVLQQYESDTGSHPINVTDYSSKLFSPMPSALLNYAETNPALYYHHSTYVPLAAYTGKQLSSNFKITSIAQSSSGRKFVNSVESINYPIFGIQFHAEKNLYEWKVAAPHNFEADLITQYFANFLVSQARQSNHTFNGTADENQYLIYQYPAYDLSDSSFTQVYIIPNFNQTSVYIPAPTQQAPIKPTTEKFLAL